MAISLIFNTGNGQAAYSRALYSVSGSTNVTNPQFQYVCDIYDQAGTTLIKRFTQTLNPGGSATFDISKIVQGELSIDKNWKINALTPFNSSSQNFNLKFGEQYGTSISSSVTVYPDLILKSNQIFFQGVVEPTAGTYNFVATQQVLSNMPTTMSMQSDDYGTISVYNDQGTYISQSFYSASVTADNYLLVDQKNYTTTGTYFNAVPISSSTNYWNYVDVSISSSFGTENYRYEASDETHREKVRFAFVNKFGAWDYYNNYNPVKQAINVSREQYTAPRVDYSSKFPTYDIQRRGLTNFHSSVDDSFTVQTDYLDKENANWLEELIESPEVYIQRNGEFIPVIITNSSYTANTNQARQKLFQYNIDFIPSNQPFGKWVPEYVTCPIVFPAGAPQVVTYANSNIGSTTLTASGSVIDSGSDALVERGFFYSTGSNPLLGNSSKITSGNGLGEFDQSITGLINSTQYYVRAYASSSFGIGYGDVVTSTTLAGYLPTGIITDGLIHFYNAWDNRNTDTVWHDSLNYGEVGEITGSIVAGQRITGSTLFQMESASYYSTFTGSQSPYDSAPPPVDFGKPWPITVNGNSDSSYTIQNFSQMPKGVDGIYTGIYSLYSASYASAGSSSALMLGRINGDTGVPIPDRLWQTNHAGTKIYDSALLASGALETPPFRLTTTYIGSASISGSGAGPTWANVQVSVDTGSFYGTDGAMSGAGKILIPDNGDGYAQNWLGKTQWTSVGTSPVFGRSWRSDTAFMYHAIYNKTLSTAEISQNYHAFISSSYI